MTAQENLRRSQAKCKGRKENRHFNRKVFGKFKVERNFFENTVIRKPYQNHTGHKKKSLRFLTFEFGFKAVLTKLFSKSSMNAHLCSAEFADLIIKSVRPRALAFRACKNLCSVSNNAGRFSKKLTLRIRRSKICATTYPTGSIDFSTIISRISFPNSYE